MFKVYETAKVIPKVKHGTRGDIGDFCFIACKGLTLEENVHIASRVTMVGKGCIYLSEGATIAPGVVFYTSMPDLKEPHKNKFGTRHRSIVGDIYVGKNVFIGANSVIGLGASIGIGINLPPFSHVKPYTIIEDEI